MDCMPSKIDPSQMSDEEIELTLELFRRKRERGGTEATQSLAPAGAPENLAPDDQIVRVASRGKSRIVPEPRWKNTVKKCPHCGKEKKVDPDFGVILARGTQYAASWCRQCRSETATAYRNKPRKNASVNNPAPKKAAKSAAAAPRKPIPPHSPAWSKK
jgi:hypothetical protein